MKMLRAGGPVFFLTAVFILPLAAAAEAPGHPLNPNEGGIMTMARWSPYVVGMGIGILSWLSALLSDNRLGASSAYVQTSAMIENAVPGNAAVDRLSYYDQHPPRVTWGWMLLVGIVVGAMLSALLSGTFRLEFLPPLWISGMGDTPMLRWITAVAGGILLSYGARWAGGCTSGHGISGTLQLAVSSWLALLCFFAGGVVTALILY